MALTCTVIGNLIKDPVGTEAYTIWKMRVFGKEVTLFSSDNSAEARANYRSGARVRGEGKGAWNEFNDTFGLQLNGAAIDGSDEEEDEAKIKVDGSFGHELEVQHDDADEGGGQYIPVEIEAPVRGKNSRGEWDDLIAYVRAMVLGSAADRLTELEGEGVTSFCFSGALDLDACFIKGQPSFYAEIDKVEVSQGRGGNDDDFWSAKPKGLASRKSPKRVAAAPTSSAARAKKKGGGGEGGGGPNDPLPFMYEWR